MKIQCDVCNKDEASVFCTADEAALCDNCDHRVHHANKLASKHQRFSLLHPSSKTHPLCDVCQEKRAFLFCQQDRAILCRDCDFPIHTANEHTQKHDRFLLTGIKLSTTSALYISSSPSSSAATNGGDLASNAKSQQVQPPIKSLAVPAVTSSDSNPVSVTKTLSSSNTVVNNCKGGDNSSLIGQGIGSTSSTLSEYLMEMLPGWRVEDFLDPPSPTLFGFSKPDEGIPPFVDTEFEGNMSSFSSSENMGFWVPQAPTIPPCYTSQHYPQSGAAGGQQNGFKETKEATTMTMKANRRWKDDTFIVPQINPPPTAGSKRSRPFW